MLKQYQIDLKNLSPSTTYEFDYLLDNDFFENVDGPEVRKGKVNVSVAVVRVSSTFEIDVQADGVITVLCDRCLEDVEIPIETENRLMVTFGETYAETSDERIIISEEEGFINMAWYLYEFIALAIPIKHVHEPGGCNEMMVSKLRELCVDEVTEGSEEETDPDESRRPIDPRWDVLRHLIEDN
jgi:uncharacterized metal-binding protein YceD (DUF177 family)